MARTVLYPADCMSCEVREGENVWEHLPVWQQKSCGGKVVEMKRLCEEEAKKRSAECICIHYIR